MIISVKVNPNDVQTYHETGAEPTEKITEIKGRQDFALLRADVESNGVKDPIIIRCEKDRVYVEVGEQRVLAARDLGITEINAIAYNVGDAEIPFTGETLADMTTLETKFSRKKHYADISGVCHYCGHDSGTTTKLIPVASFKTIEDYISAGIAKF